MAGWSRTTVVNRDTTAAAVCAMGPCPPNDIVRVTVTVRAPAPAVPVARSISIAAF